MAGSWYGQTGQDLAEQDIGGSVKVIGTLDSKTDTIRVQRIEPMQDKSVLDAQKKPKE